MLNKLQSLIIETLADSFLKERFYWTGGTLLAEKYLHHRNSVDIDLFSDKSFLYEEVAPLVKTIQKKAGLV